MSDSKKPNFLKGAAILAGASVIVKIVGAIYKIPLFQDGVLGDEGTADFQVTYSIYSFILTIATAGVPAALSRLVSAAKAKNDTVLIRRYFTVALISFFIIGLITMSVMFFFADSFAGAMGNTMAALGIRVLAPAVFFVCIISVYRGYAQGYQNMFPTAISQIVEVLCKAIFGIAAALWFVSLGYQPHVVSAGAIIGVTIGLGLCIPVLIWYKRRLDRQNDETQQTDPDTDPESEPIEASTAEKASGFESVSKTQPELLTRSFVGTLRQIMKVSIPITISASFMSIMVVIDNSIVLRRLQGTLGMTESAARVEFGMHSKALSVFNLTPALLVPISVSIIPAIAAAIAARQKDEAKTIMQSSLKIVNLIAMPAAAGIMVLASPILTALYNDQRTTASTIMAILGAATIFVCLQYVTTSILQANGFERVSLLTFPAGAFIRIILSWILAGNPDYGILAPSISTLICFAVITGLNILFIIIKLKDNRPKLKSVFVGPALCSAVMAGFAYAIYKLLEIFLPETITNARIEAILFLGAAILISVCIYAVMIIVTRTVTADDMKLVPKGEKIAALLRIK